ncbi:spore maturation protein A [Geosporobacter subterraneus DSM 17957]|uniref:Spore maturation protein A n=1 Tax=Geosporobacter subterraneus DSM 17957 TaxID=1121919 RepID=A0A1M6PRR1_9FIRM|nr:nucleoside recognition domain-containing protein [Geosporobacter subterraneus]SHK10571.1 spore maturation protein A [Geosporobacter subterraneus DSM 17957]
MMNIMWVSMILIGIFVALMKGQLDIVNQVVINHTQEAVVFAIGLIGIMSVWLGLMKIAERSGLIDSIGRLMGPMVRLLFPEVPPNHPAISAMVMNLAANMFGAGNSATALGLKAMEELQQLNTKKERATNAMCMFLVINMSSVQLVPLTVLKIRSDAGSANPAEIIGTTLIATTVSTIVGILACKILERNR